MRRVLTRGRPQVTQLRGRLTLLATAEGRIQELSSEVAQLRSESAVHTRMLSDLGVSAESHAQATQAHASALAEVEARAEAAEEAARLASTDAAQAREREQGTEKKRRPPLPTVAPTHVPTVHSLC